MNDDTYLMSDNRQCSNQEYLNSSTGLCEYCERYVAQDVTYCGECYDIEQIQYIDGEYRYCVPCSKFHADYVKGKCQCADQDIGAPPQISCKACGLGRTADETHTYCVCATYFSYVGDNCLPDNMMTGCLICTILSFLIGLGGFVWWLWELRYRSRTVVVSDREPMLLGPVDYGNPQEYREENAPANLGYSK